MQAVKHRLSLFLCLSLSVLVSQQGVQAASTNWTPGSNLAGARTDAASALLADGRALFTGGSDASGPLTTTEIFNVDGSFSTAASMHDARANHTAVTLKDGRVLVTGGTTSSGAVTNSAELYDPAANTWTLAGSGMAIPRSGHTASLLNDGRVLIAGGQSANGATNTLEIFSPATNTFSLLTSGTLGAPATQHAAAVLLDGRVLIAGGFNGSAPVAAVSIFDPASGAISAAPSMSIPRANLSATTLLDGTVLLAGGNNGSADLALAEIYNPATQTLAVTGSLAMPRSGHLAFLLPNNNEVLIAGGSSAEAALQSAELFVPWTGSFIGTGAMGTARTGATGVALKQSGQLIVAGGANGTNTFAASELYHFATLATDAADYPPGTNVHISGTGWEPGETVTLTLLESPFYDTHGPYTAVADTNGNISNSDFTPDPDDANIRFYLTAKGSVSQAQMTFTDSNVASVTVGAQTPSPILPGNSATYQIDVRFNGNSTACSASLSVTGLPSGMAVNFSPSALTGDGSTHQTLSSSLSITPPSGTEPASYPFTVSARPTTGCSGGTQTGSGTLVVGGTPATTLSVSAATGIYGGTTSLSATLTTSGGTPVPGKTISFTLNGSAVGPVTTNANGVATASAVSLSGINVGSYSSGITANFAGDANFGASSGTGSLTVSKATPSVVLTGGTYPYDGNPHPPTISITGVAGDQSLTSSMVTLTYTPANSSVPVNAGQYSVVGSFAGNANYNSVTSNPATIIINKVNANVSVTGYTVTYDGNPHTANGTAVGVKGESLSGLDLTATIHTNSGTYTDSWIFTDTTGNYNSASGNVVDAIAPATPGVTTPTPSGTSTYGTTVTLSVTISAPDGAPTPTGTVQFQFTNAGTTNNICSDGSLQAQPAGTPCAITLVNGTASVTTSNLPAGTTADAVTATYIPASGGNYTGGSTTINYTVGTATTQTTVSITPATGATYGDTLTLAAAVANSSQGSTAMPVGTVQFQYSVEGGATWVNVGTTVPLDANGKAQTTTTALPAGTPEVRAVYSGNSNFAGSNSGLTAYSVSRKELTVSGITASDKTYDATATATLDTSNAQLSGVVGTDDVTLERNGVTGTFSDPNAGDGKTVTITGFSITGAAASNYTLKQPTTTASISPATPTLAVTGGTSTYTGDPHPATVSIAGVTGDSSLTPSMVTLTYTPGGSSAPVNAGPYSVTGNFPGNQNYRPVTSSSATITINKADATVNVTPYSVTYDGNAHTASGTATGVKGEPLNGLDLSGTTHTNAGPPYADTWTFTDNTGNYNSRTGTVTDTINKADATVNVTPYNVTYDGNAHTATGTATGVKGENLSGLDLTHTTHTNAGPYADTWTFTDSTGNYNGRTGTVTDTINKADATVNVTPYSVTYDGNAHTASGTATGVKGENLSGLDLTHTTHTNAGPPYPDTWTFTDTTGNYNSTTGTVSDTINKANATVAVTPYSVTYDGNAHTASGTATGVKGESLSSGLNLAGTTHTNAGNYTNDAWTFTDASGNYNNTDGVVSDTIAKADPTVSVMPYSLTYDGNAHTATGTATGVKGENLSGGLNLAGTTHTNAGIYTDAWIFNDPAGNYNAKNGSVSDTISAATPSVIVTPGGPYVFDGAAHPATAMVTGIHGVTVNGSLVITYSPSTSVPVNAGAYTVTAIFASGDTNYTNATGAGTLVINPAPTSTILTSKITPLNGLATVQLTTAVTSTVAPVGTITFVDLANNSTVLGTASVVAGQASIAVPASSLAVGTHIIAANFIPGNTNFCTSSSAATPNRATLGAIITDPSSSSDVFAAGSTVNLKGTFTPGTLSNASAVWTVTNPSASPVTNVSTQATISTGISGSQPLTTAGVYNLALTFTDGLGGIVLTNTVGGNPAMIVIYDPSAGFVTGGGWINSPLNAYTANPSLTGKATFGFVSKYQRGATVPTGDTQFTFQVGNLDFHSTSYDWLVISGPMAQYKGSGTINGAGNYKFVLTARDGSMVGNNTPDGFRIKITDQSGGVVYDNVPGNSDAASSGNTQALGGGSVIIHN